MKKVFLPRPLGVAWKIAKLVVVGVLCSVGGCNSSGTGWQEVVVTRSTKRVQS